MFNQEQLADSTSSYRRAVVIGGSVAGLTAARVLADHFEDVTIIERGNMANGLEFPQGAPQARHPHVLLIRGEQILDGFFPGFSNDLLDGGATRLNFGRDLKIRFPDGWLPQYETELEATATSRLLLDHVIYQRLLKHPNVNVRANSEVVSLCTDGSNEQVIGVQIRSRATRHVEDIPAELVVDASGRSSKAPQWLTQLGFTPPEEQKVNAFPGYSTRIFEIPQDFQQSWQTLYIMPNPPHVTRGAIIVPMEGNQWHVSLVGMNRDYPPTDEEGFMAFARSLVSPEVYEALSIAKPVSPIWGYRHAENRLRRFDNMPAYLEGFVALGDAVYALNPVYGQGMTLAAIACQLLDECLTEQTRNGGGDSLSGIAELFQRRLKNELAIPWQTATNEDMRWPDTEGKQALDLPSKLIGRYFKLVLKAMPHSTKVTDAFYQVQHMIAPPTILMKPTILSNVIASNLRLRLSGS